MKTPTDVLAVIPARGGSKRLPGKNLKPLAGLPLVAHTIRLAKSCPRIDRCVVSTDSDAIAQIAKAYGAEAPFLRPPELARDDVPAIQPVLHAVRWLERHEGYRPECVMLLQPTSPLRTIEDLQGALKLFVERQADSVVSVAPAQLGLSWLKTIDADGRLSKGAELNGHAVAAHDEPLYRLNGAMYLIKRDVLLDRQSWYTENTHAYVMPLERSVDVDTAWDFQVAERLLKVRRPTVVCVGDRLIGPGQRCFIIAEAGVNHNGDPALAHRLIDAAAAAGADAVKFQSFVTEELITRDAPKAGYQVQATGSNDGQYRMLKALELDEAAHAALKAHCERVGVLYLCTPYEPTSVERLDRLGVAAFKISSTDATNLPLLRVIASKGRPVILSTGMCAMAEVERAVETLIAGGLAGHLVLLQCVSAYPTPIDQANVRAMQVLGERFHMPVGYSDHTEGLGAGPWAVAAGACVIEKHVTLDRTRPGPDHRASLNPEELAQLVRAIREVEAAMGHGVKEPMPCERDNKPLMQKSLVAARPIRKGDVITAEALTCKRPGTGLDPSRLESVIARRAAADIQADQVLTRESIAWEAGDIRALVPEFAQSLGAFFRALSDAGDGRWFHPHPLTEEEARRLVRYQGRDAYYVLVQDEVVLGYGMLRGWDEGFAVPSLGLAIHPATRGRGFGEALSRFLHEEARRRGAARVRLKVYPENTAALKLYQRFGYVFQHEETGQWLGILELG